MKKGKKVFLEQLVQQEIPEQLETQVQLATLARQVILVLQAPQEKKEPKEIKEMLEQLELQVPLVPLDRQDQLV